MLNRRKYILKYFDGTFIILIFIQHIGLQVTAVSGCQFACCLFGRCPCQIQIDLSLLIIILTNIYNTLMRSEEHTSELQSRPHLVCRLLLEKKKKKKNKIK